MVLIVIIFNFFCRWCRWQRKCQKTRAISGLCISQGDLQSRLKLMWLK